MLLDGRHVFSNHALFDDKQACQFEPQILRPDLSVHNDSLGTLYIMLNCQSKVKHHSQINEFSTGEITLVFFDSNLSGKLAYSYFWRVLCLACYTSL